MIGGFIDWLDLGFLDFSYDEIDPSSTGNKRMRGCWTRKVDSIAE